MARNKTLELAQHFGIGPFAKKQSRTNTTPSVETESEKPSRRTGTLPDAPLHILYTEPEPFGSSWDIYKEPALEKPKVQAFEDVASHITTQIQERSVFLAGPVGVGKTAIMKELARLSVDDFVNIKSKKEFSEKIPFAFRFQRDGMCYQVQFANAYGDTHPDFNKVKFQLSSQKPEKKYLIDAMGMRRAEAQFAIDVIAASLTIDQHEKYAATLQRLRDHLPTAEDDLRNEQIENLPQDPGKFNKYMIFEESFEENDVAVRKEMFDKLNEIFSETQLDRFKFIPFKKFTP
jgi:hypothetical protein